uniref:Uncharacterized protein n=1 Tax=uncultured bacterium contig00053 TaxID=1181537 RepID=A0A806KJW6_9BACT|nr:hypothetical protein [uncultured bacterium contig00053]
MRHTPHQKVHCIQQNDDENRSIEIVRRRFCVILRIWQTRRTYWMRTFLAETA